MPSKEIEYETIGKEDLGKALGESIPSYATPTKWTAYILSGIFVLVILIGALQFPFSSVLGGNVDNSLKLGIPFTFLELKFSGDTTNPLRPINLILDLFIYILLAYLIDIGFHMMRYSKSSSTDNRPTMYEYKSESYAEKVTKKVFDK